MATKKTVEKVEEVAEKKPAKKAAPKGPVLVKMVRDGKNANVHPDEVANFASHGWVEV